MIELLPDRPDHPDYWRALTEIKNDLDQKRAAARFRALCEADFWAFCRFSTPLRNFKIESKDKHVNTGQLWIDQPFLFEKCRDIQEDSEAGTTGKFYNWSRGFLKTTLITRHLTEWELLKFPQRCYLILTWKLDQTGEGMLLAIKEDFETDKIMRAHWPDRLWQDGESAPLWTGNRISIKRTPGPREPSVSAHGLDSMPTSFHGEVIIRDDCVAQKVVETEEAMMKCLRSIRRTVFLAKMGSAITRDVGTVWDENDPNMQLLREGFFTERDHEPMCLPAETDVEDRDGFSRAVLSGAVEVQLVSPSAAIEQRKAGAYDFSCNCQGVPSARGDRLFKPQWWHFYQSDPLRMLTKGYVYAVIDPAGGHEGGDFTAIRFQLWTPEKLRFNLDLWRERYGLVETIDLLFGPEEEMDLRLWHGPKRWDPNLREEVPCGLVDKWKPRLCCIESYAESGWYDSIVKAARSRDRHGFKIKRLPALKRAKRNRIIQLQPAYERGEMYYPEKGFGHGSRHDTRDTMEQYRSDEYSKFTLEKDSVRNDDGLDSDGWFVQPEVENHLFRWPRIVEVSDPRRHDPTIGKTSYELNRGSRYGGVTSWGR